jgi:hypothetical protein
MADTKMQPGDIQVSMDRDRGMEFYKQMNHAVAASVSEKNALGRLVDKLEELGYKVIEDAGGVERISTSGVPGLVSFIVTRAELRVIRKRFVALIMPGSQQQVPYIYERRRVMPILEDLGIRRVVEKEAYEGDKSKEEAEEALTDVELAAEEAKEKPAAKPEAPKEKDLLKKE